MNIHWIPFDKNSIQAILDELLTLTAPGTPPDFSRILVIVPGRLWERTLKEALALRFPDGVCPPRMVTPGRALRFGVEELRAVTPHEAIEVWENVLQSDFDTPAMELLFPARERAFGENDRRNMAKLFSNLHEELAQNGLTIAQAAEQLADDDGRWYALTELEKRFQAKLAELQLSDTAAVERAATQAHRALAEHFSHILIAFVPDLPKLLVEKLSPLADMVTILAHAETGDAAAFDEWARPLPAVWNARRLPLAPEQLHCVNNPEQAALLTLELATQGGKRPFDPAQSAIALGRAAFFPAFRDVFSELTYSGENKHVTLFSPDGEAGTKLRIGSFLTKLYQVLRAPEDFPLLKALLADEAFQGYLRSGSAFSENDFLAALDAFMLEALPDRTSHAIRFMEIRNPELGAIVRKAAETVAELQNAPDFVQELKLLLKSIFTRPGYAPVRAIGFDDEARYFQEALDALAHSPVNALLTGADRKLRYLVESGENARFYPGRDDDAITVYNFLELPALPQPELYLTGMNWGIVPGVPGTTPYLTDSIRKRLGLSNSESLAALEAYKLFALLGKSQTVYLFVLELDEKNAPLRPAGMLFQGCDAPELLARATRCRTPETSSIVTGSPEADAEFRLNFSHLNELPFFQNKPLVLSVTDFKAYFASPRAFLLEKVLRVECFDYANRELEASDFGSAIHKGFETLRTANCTSKADYLHALTAGADRYLSGKCGVPLPLLVSLQQKQIHARLEAAAEYLASVHGSYQLLEAEYKLNAKQGIEFGGALIKGTIDRIELADNGRTLRLVDLKTYNSAVTPEKDHLKGAAKNKTLINLQLPLYERLLKLDREFWIRHNLDPDAVTVEAGYLLLTADSETAQYVPWGKDFYDWCLKAEERVAEVVAALLQFRDTGELEHEPASVNYYDLAPLLLPSGEKAVITEVTK